MINKIIPKYKTTFKNSEFLQIVESLINYENLKNEGLNEDEIQTILMLHFPKDLIELFFQKTLRSDIIQTLKTIEAYNHFKKLKGKRVDFPASASLDGDI